MRRIKWKWLAGALALTAIVTATGRLIVTSVRRHAFVAEACAGHTMTNAEAGRLYDITQTNTRSGADADWLIAAATRADGRKADRTPLYAVLLAGTDRAAMTPARREAIFQIAASLAATPPAESGDGGRRYAAVMLFKKLHDDRALAYLRAMSESEEPLVRFDSRQLIHQMTSRYQTSTSK